MRAALDFLKLIAWFLFAGIAMLLPFAIFIGFVFLLALAVRTAWYWGG